MMNTATVGFTCRLIRRLPFFTRMVDVPFDQGDLAGVREPLADVLRGGCDLDGAQLAAAVSFLLGGVLDRDGTPSPGRRVPPAAFSCSI
jgi:hypothetical protein